MNLKSAFQDSERAVSPVIGVILMVAITVILAAVIGTFVLGLGDQISQNANAGVTVDNSSGSPVVTLTSLGQGTESIKCVPSGSGSTSTVGETITCSSGDSVVAVTDEGEETVIRTDI